MRFSLLDRVLDIEPGKSITAVKAVTLAEEYLADHFPRFPVLPGVFMLEALTQASAWTIRLGEDFAHSIVVLRSARNVKYGDFVEPGKTLTVSIEVLSQDESITKVKATGKVGDRTSLTARLTLERYNLADRLPHGAALDARVRGGDASPVGDSLPVSTAIGPHPGRLLHLAGSGRGPRRWHGLIGSLERRPSFDARLPPHEAPVADRGKRRLFYGRPSGKRPRMAFFTES